MRIRLRDGLPFVAATVEYRSRRAFLENALLDTGSAGTVFAIDRLQTIGLEYEPEDRVRRIRGIGGAEFVFSKRVDRLALGKLAIQAFEIEVGAMDYGFEIDGIIGMDFLTAIGAVIDLARLDMRKARKSGQARE
jgi:predicted aspartyl protease